jgi:hypothetical protein
VDHRPTANSPEELLVTQPASPEVGGSADANLQARGSQALKAALQQLARRRGRKLSDEIRAALYAHLRRAGIVLPEDPHSEAPPMTPEALAAIAHDLEALVEEARGQADRDPRRQQQRTRSAG